MKHYRAALVHKSLGEIIPRRALDRANASGRWFRLYSPAMPKRGYGYKTEAAAVAALTRISKKMPTERRNDWRGLVWLAGRETAPATTIAI